MRTEKARELKVGGWHWYGGFSDCRSRKCDPHSTEKESQECQWNHEIETSTKFKSSSPDPCKECVDLGKKGSETWTDVMMQLGGYMNSMVVLCEEHATKEVLRKHTSPPQVRWKS